MPHSTDPIDASRCRAAVEDRVNGQRYWLASGVHVVPLIRQCARGPMLGADVCFQHRALNGKTINYYVPHKREK